MLVVVADEHDQVAQALAARWQSCGVGLLTPADLSRPGWRYRFGGLPDAEHGGTAVIAGDRVPIGKIEGVLTRLPAISAASLPHIVPADREYVAAEMTAFLRAWLSSLACPVLNRPTSQSLTGPPWSPSHWAHAAARVGLPVRQAEDVDTGMDTPTVSVVGERCFGPQPLTDAARRLACVAGVSLLSVRFAGPAFVSADPCPPLTTSEVADAVLAYLRRKR